MPKVLKREAYTRLPFNFEHVEMLPIEGFQQAESQIKAGDAIVIARDGVPQLAKAAGRAHVEAMKSMPNDDLFSRKTARSRGSSARAKTIDQDGREIHSGPLGADGFNAGAFG